jgi:hypothetical protein
MRSRFPLTWIALGVLAVAPVLPTLLLADGSQLGTVSGRVLDEDGRPLPGASVEIVSGDKGFRRSQETDASGSFTFALLQPGPYTLWVTLPGFQSVEATNNIVAPEKTTRVNATLMLTAAEAAVTVLGEIPLVDKTDTTARTTVSSTLTQKLAIGRNYQTLIATAPGVTNNSGGTPNVHGALDSNNLYLFDGVDSTDTVTGTFGQNFNFEAIQEMVVSTAGISAEFGRATGAIVNVITKSGTNNFSGSGKVILTNDEWNDDNKGHFNRDKFDEVVDRYALTLGGPFWKDHLWFFGAYEWAKIPSPFATTAESPDHPQGTREEYQQTTDVKLWDAKLTFQATPSHLFTAQANADPINGFVIDYWDFIAPSAEREALTQQNQNDCGGICEWQGRWAGVFGSNFSAEALYAEQDGDIFVVPFEGHGTPYYSFADGLFYNGATFDGFVKRPRKQASIAATLYTNLFGDAHTFKGGVDYQDLESTAFFTFPNNQEFLVADFDPINRQPTLVPGDLRLDFIDPAPSVSKGKILGFYALDKFEVGKNLFFNLGIRVDNQTSDSDIGNTVVDATTVSPRLTGVYDLFQNGKTLFSGSYGRYYQALTQAVADSIYAGVAQQSNYDAYAWDGSQFVLKDQFRVGAGISPVNDDLKPSYLDEFNVAIQQQLWNTMAVGIRGIYRQWKDLIDDRRFVDSNGNKLTEPVNFGDELRRYYKGIELTFEKRFSRNWQASMNYTLSRSEGNSFSDFSSQLFDYANQTCNITDQPVVGRIACPQATDVNRYGYAPYDRTHIFQAFTAYTLPLKWVAITAAPSFYWQSGLPYQKQRTFEINGELDTYFYEKRSSHRLPNQYQLDFALEAVFKPWGPFEMGAKGEVFNVTNQQYQITCTGTCVNPGASFGIPTSRGNFQAPRGYRLTALARF